MDKSSAARDMFGFTRGDSDPELLPLSPIQQTNLMSTLSLLDEADPFYDSKDTQRYAIKFERARELHEQSINLFPSRDLRLNLLNSIMKAYQDVGTLLLATDLNKYKDVPDPMAAAGRIRKAFLRQIIEGKLDKNGQSFLDYLLGDKENETRKNMRVKIPLPKITKAPNAMAHPFPLQITFQTYEFINGMMFYAMVSDIASGKYVRLPKGLDKIEEEVLQGGLSKKAWDEGWEQLQKYMPVFEKSVFQSVVILARSHWDWYIRQLGGFVRFARKHVPSPLLDKQQQKSLDSVDRKEIKKQLSILEESCGVTFSIPNTVMSSVEEMSLVRNLGMHNRWEVDSFYLSKTSTTNLEVGDVRLFEITELQNWISSLTKLLNETSLPIAEKYVFAPDYP
jgi:hypothetical protein